MSRFILFVLLCAACSGNGDDSPNLPPKSPPPSKPAATCPQDISGLTVPCSPGLVCDFRNGASTLRCGCSLEQKLSCGELPL